MRMGLPSPGKIPHFLATLTPCLPPCPPSTYFPLPHLCLQWAAASWCSGFPSGAMFQSFPRKMGPSLVSGSWDHSLNFWRFQLYCEHLLSIPLVIVNKHTLQRNFRNENLRPFRDNGIHPFIKNKTALKKFLQHAKLWPSEQSLNLVQFPENIFGSIFFFLVLYCAVCLCVPMHVCL